MKNLIPRSSIQAFTITAVLLALPLVSRAATILVYNTDQGNLASGSNDPHWTDTSASNPNGAGGAAIVNGVYGGWDPLTQSGAIGVKDVVNQPAVSGPDSEYSFNQDFSLAGLDLTTVSLTGYIAIDDNATFSLNGHLIATMGPGFGLWGNGNDNFSILGSSGWFNQGLNTLTVTMTWTDGVYDAAIVNFTNATADAIPTSTVPDSGATVALLGGACIGLAILRRRFVKRGFAV
jgi:hypothetical protein